MKYLGYILLKIYQIISILILPILLLMVLWRRKKGKEHRDRFLERFAITKIKRPQNCKLLWVHAVSVGESNSAWVLIEDLLKLNQEIKIIFTSTTTSSAQIIEQKINNNHFFKQNIIHQFLPLDSYLLVAKFLRYWQPQAGIFIESEIWPNFVALARQKSIPTFLINARLSRKSASRWYFLKILGFNIFDNFSLIFAQTYQYKKILQNLTNQEICFEGNLKNHGKILEFNHQDLLYLQQQIGTRRIFLCASTHRGEEPLILDVHSQLKLLFPDLITIIVLRHPTRAKEVKELLKNHNFAQRSEGQIIDDNVEIYLVDSLGEMGIFYSLAHFAFIGGSLLDGIGGHNPIEAMQLNCAIITGQYFYNNSAIYEDLLKNNACKIAEDKDELLKIIVEFFNNPQIMIDINKNAQKLMINQNEVVIKIVAKIDEVLKK